jgi:hypothetical protein
VSIESELLIIKGNNEMLTAEAVVEWARKHPESALYKAPEFHGWDVNKSAYEHWLWGARRLIAIHVVYEDGQRKFISLSLDRTKEHGGYRDIDDVLRDKSLHDIMLADALRELDRVQARYERLKELTPIWREAANLRRRNSRAGKAVLGQDQPSSARPRVA